MNEKIILGQSKCEDQKKIPKLTPKYFRLVFLALSVWRVFLPQENVGGNIRQREKMECTLAIKKEGSISCIKTEIFDQLGLFLMEGETEGTGGMSMMLETLHNVLTLKHTNWRFEQKFIVKQKRILAQAPYTNQIIQKMTIGRFKNTPHQPSQEVIQ